MGIRCIKPPIYVRMGLGLFGAVFSPYLFPFKKTGRYWKDYNQFYLLSGRGAVDNSSHMKCLIKSMKSIHGKISKVGTEWPSTLPANRWLSCCKASVLTTSASMLPCFLILNSQAVSVRHNLICVCLCDESLWATRAACQCTASPETIDSHCNADCQLWRHTHRHAVMYTNIKGCTHTVSGQPPCLWTALYCCWPPVLLDIEQWKHSDSSSDSGSAGSDHQHLSLHEHTVVFLVALRVGVNEKQYILFSWLGWQKKKKVINEVKWKFRLLPLLQDLERLPFFPFQNL